MPKKTKIKMDLPKICQMHTLDILLYAHVSAIMEFAPGVSLKAAINNFINKYNINEDDWAFTTMEQAFFKYTDRELNTIEKVTI